MGGAPWQFKKFADASSKAWFTRKWQDKVFGGFTLSLIHILSDQHDSAPGSLCNVSQTAEYWAHLVCSVHVHILSLIHILFAASALYGPLAYKADNREKK